MQQNFIDSSTLQPKRFGELYSDRNIRLAGEARYLSGSSQVETRGLRIICTPSNGGAEAITIVPNGIYPLSASDTSLWLQVQRTAGSSTAVFGSTFLSVGAGAQFTPRENWVQLFYRSSTTEIIAFGSFLIGISPNWTRIGITRANGIYDAVVGTNAADPNVTHTNIQTAINDCVDGNRILILEGTYLISTATGYSATSALSWSGKTLTLEGEGYNTIIQNGGGFARAFSIQSTTAGLTAANGSASRILNLQVSLFNQSVQFDGGVGFGIRNVDVNIWMTDFVTASYVTPAVVGTGTSEQNSVREKTTSGTGVAQEKYTIASGTAASNITRIEASGTLTFNELVDFQRQTSGYGILPLGSVLATFPNLTGAYVCTSTTAADARGFVQCNGQVIADATSPMNGVTIPNINNNVFLAGNITSGTVGGANSLGTTVPSAGYTTSGTNTPASITWNSANVGASGSGSFDKSVMNTGQPGHIHGFNGGVHTHPAGTYFTPLYIQAAGAGSSPSAIEFFHIHNSVAAPLTWTPNKYSVFSGSGPQTEAGQAPPGPAGVPLTSMIPTRGSAGPAGVTGSINPNTVSWDPAPVTVPVSGVAVNKNSWNSDQNAHTHPWSGSVAGVATASTWDNRPQYITARYIMRIK